MATTSDRPNILHIVPHDLGDWLGCLGHTDVSSPRLDELAEKGIRFTHHFGASTCCSPARGCTMTGRYAHNNGLMGLVNQGWRLPPEQLTLVDHFREAGYQTVHGGFQHERVHREDNRYEILLDSGQGIEATYCDNACSAAEAFLRARRPGDPPFYLNLGFFEVHAPWNRPEYEGHCRPEDVILPQFLPDLPLVREALARFYGAIAHFDACIGGVLDALDETGLTDNTLVVFTTDHGISFPRAKETLYEPGIQTALVLRWPGHIAPGQSYGGLISSIDLAPTLLEAIGQPVPPALQGRSFWPLLTGDLYTPRSELFSERNWHCYFDPNRTVRTERYKLIRNYARRGRMPYPHEINEAKTMRDLYRRDTSGEDRPYEQLFDLEADPWEMHNVVDEPAYAETLADLRGRLDAWMIETADFMRGADMEILWPELGDWDRREEFVIPSGRGGE
jgi:N-sulfoglucosamine sulfohydrolase